RMVCHCLLIETAAGLVLVDTGLGADDIARPRERLGRWFLPITRPRPPLGGAALPPGRRPGLSPRDGRHALPPHPALHPPRGLPDFPAAQVHLFADEHEAAMHPSGRERMRYRPAHFAHGPRWALHRPGGEPWMGFDCVRDLPGLPPEILIVPVPGHTRGHS